jgi:chromosome segregation ATPase
MPSLMSTNGGFQQHAQTAIQVILVAITMWVGSAIITLRDSSIRLEEQYKQTRESLTELKAELAALRILIASSSERQVDFNYRLNNLEARIVNLEKVIGVKRP